MHMGVDEARHQESRIDRTAAGHDRLDPAVPHAHLAGLHAALVQIHDLMAQHER
jgi:hypothetical protein